MERTILHCDLNGFYAAVACVQDPALQFVPMAVAGDPKNRHGIILAKNELAKRYHVQTAETIWQAKQKCPNLVLVPPQHEQYLHYSRRINEIYGEFSDLVEPFGIDESWLDVSGVCHLFGSGVEIADRLRALVKERLELTISVGVSFNKVFAKLGSDYKKPDATTLITRENYRDLVWPLPASDLLYVGKVTAETLARLGIRSIGDLARSDRPLISARLGKLGTQIHDYANGLDCSPVRAASEARAVKSVGNGLTFPRDLLGYEDLAGALLALSDTVASRLRHKGLYASVISLSIKAPDFKTRSKQATLHTPTHLAKEIAGLSFALLKSCWSPTSAVRSLSISVSQLSEASAPSEQLSLFAPTEESFDRAKQEKLEAALDQIRGKYGRNAIRLGSHFPDKH